MEVENRACEPPRQPALRPAILEIAGGNSPISFANSRGLLQVTILVSAGRNFGVFLVTSCFLH